MENNLKLNTKRTIYIGFAFFGILMLWQLYNHYCPLFLDHLLQHKLADENNRWYIIGIIMAVDNIVALFMLPLFGNLSDKTKTKYGKRMPYIVVGMIFSIIVFPFISIAFIYKSLVGVIVMMGLTLIIMNVYRSPAVSLMPDVTPKPLRSKANGIINLIGYLGAIIAGGLATVFAFKADNNNNLIPFLIVSGFLLAALIILIMNINENKILAEVSEDMHLGELASETDEIISEAKPLSKIDKRNLIILLISTFLWFAAFNAVETFLSVYSKEVIGSEKIAGVVVIILTFSSILTFIPAGLLSSKIGRKKSVTLGLILISAALITLIFLQSANFLFYIMFAIAGIGWATINVNSYPMLVEMTHQGNVGKYTGFYYTSSMLAQSFTPIIAGAIMTFKHGPKPLFPYASVLMGLAFIVFILFKEQSRRSVVVKTGFAAFDED